MLLGVKDASGETETIAVQAVETPVDRSGVISADPYTVVMEANADRAGWYFQNKGAANMVLYEFGQDPDDGGGFVVVPNAFFPPPGYPITVEEIRVTGTAPQAFAAREW